MNYTLDTEETAKLIKMISVNLWKTGKIPEDWIKRNIPILEKRNKEDSGSYNHANLMSSCPKYFLVWCSLVQL